MHPQKSIVLVTVDCLRADHVGFMGYERRTTPFLDSLAADSFVIPSAIVAGAPTYYSFPAILGSRHSLALGRDVLGLAPGEASLASVLKKAGYTTAGINAANPYLSSQFGYEQGFEEFHDNLSDEHAASSVGMATSVPNGWPSRLNLKMQSMRPALGPFRIFYDELYFRYCQRVTPPAQSIDALRPYPTADMIIGQACTWLKSVGDKPFFLWLHLMDPHAPYYPKEEALALVGHGPLSPDRARYLNSYWNRSELGPSRLARHREEIVALYDAGIRWVDAQMARLVDSLRASKRWDDCVFALTADHGEEFLDHGGRFHSPSKLMEELIHVPLLLRVPGSAKKDVKKTPFTLLDLAPTLLEAAQIAPPQEFQGRSRWDEISHGNDPGGIAISECVAGCTNPFRPDGRLGPRVLTVREARFKLALQFDPPSEQLYDLEADPGEHAPLAPKAQTTVRRRLLEAAREHLHRSSGQRDERVRLRARVRDLQLEWMRPISKRV